MTTSSDVIWFGPGRIPAGNWPFINTIRNSLLLLAEKATADVDLTEGGSDVLISGCMSAYRLTVAVRVLELAKSAILLWNGGAMLGAIVVSRALLETVAIYHAFCEQATELVEKADWALLSELTDAYAFFSTDNGIKEVRNKRTIGDLEIPFIGKAVESYLAKKQPGAEKFWDQICDESHPNGKRMMSFAAHLDGTHFVRHEAGRYECRAFRAVYNCLYASLNVMEDTEFEILLERVRTGRPLEQDHPLMKEKRLVDDVVRGIVESWKGGHEGTGAEDL